MSEGEGGAILGPDLSELDQRLVELGYANLFQRLGDEAIESVWAGGRASQTLQALVVAEAAALPARFLAAEILFDRLAEYPVPGTEPVLAGVYAAALEGAFCGAANPWGLPGHLDGQVGINLTSIGMAAVPSLSPLLTDETPVGYEGSEAATIGDSYRFRIKDLAAYFVARIAGLPFTVDEETERRDREIVALSARLGETTAEE